MKLIAVIDHVTAGDLLPHDIFLEGHLGDAEMKVGLAQSGPSINVCLSADAPVTRLRFLTEAEHSHEQLSELRTLTNALNSKVDLGPKPDQVVEDRVVVSAYVVGTAKKSRLFRIQSLMEQVEKTLSGSNKVLSVSEANVVKVDLGARELDSQGGELRHNLSYRRGQHDADGTEGQQEEA